MAKKAISLKPFIISRKELSARLGVSPATTRRLEVEGSISRIMVGGQARYEWEVVLDQLKSREVSRG